MHSLAINFSYTPVQEENFDLNTADVRGWAAATTLRVGAMCRIYGQAVLRKRRWARGWVGVEEFEKCWLTDDDDDDTQEEAPMLFVKQCDAFREYMCGIYSPDWGARHLGTHLD